MIRLSGLWKTISESGQVYYSGSINNRLKILVFPNRNKQPGSNQPDFEVCIKQIEPKEMEGIADEHERADD